MLVENLPVFICVVSVGIFVQSATGFAAGLLIMPLMMWVGFSIPEAQAALLVSTLPQNLWGFHQFRESLSIRELVLPASLRLLALPLGIVALVAITDFPQGILRQGIGLLVIVCVLALLVFKPKPQDELHIGWTWLAFLSSGFFQGCTGTGGPMMVLWVQAHDWSTKRTRAFLFAMYLMTVLPALVLLYVGFQDEIVAPICSSLLALPVLFGMTLLGLQLGTWLGRNRLRKVTMALLLVIGVTSFASPWLVQLLP